MAMTTGVGKASALAAQIVLGWILFEDDWGLYALTLSVAALLQLLRNGGIGHVLIQRGPDAYAALVDFDFVGQFLKHLD